jgi:hypothetical protein
VKATLDAAPETCFLIVIMITITLLCRCKFFRRVLPDLCLFINCDQSETSSTLLSSVRFFQYRSFILQFISLTSAVVFLLSWRGFGRDLMNLAAASARTRSQIISCILFNLRLFSIPPISIFRSPFSFQI